MGQTLTNGIYLPDEGEVRCYDGLAANWTTLDLVVGGYRAHIANENIHITSAERSKWNNGVNQAYVLRYASVSLTALGTVAFSALDNTDNIKAGDKVLDSEGKLFALTAVDTDNSSATLSALLIDLSKDSDLSNYYTKTETDNLLSDKANDSSVMHLSGNETVNGVKSFTDNIIAQTSINGINPGALSFPDLSSGLDISSYLTTGNSDNSYTPLVDGFISVKINNKASCAIYANQGDLYTSSFGNIIDIDLGGYSASFFMPLIKNVACRIVCRNAGAIVSAKFFPNLGNV